MFLSTVYCVSKEAEDESVCNQIDNGKYDSDDGYDETYCRETAFSSDFSILLFGDDSEDKAQC